MSMPIRRLMYVSISAERLAHPPLGARASVERGVKVVISENHVNRAAPSGWMERLVVLLRYSRPKQATYLACQPLFLA